MNFQEYLHNAWSTHAEDPKKVADELRAAFNLMESGEDVMAMSRLIVHVCGEHLGEWQRGIELLRKLKNNATISDRSEMNRLVAILTLGNNPSVSIENFSTSDQVRIYCATASALINLGGVKNSEIFLKKSLDLMESIPAKDDPAYKSIAMAANNIASVLEEKIEINKREVELMILAATTGRKFWDIAGNWKEIERAEYHLAKSFLKAKLPEKAILHARECLAIVDSNGNEPLEVFFAFEVIALAEGALKNLAGSKRALENMQYAFDKLESDDQTLCKKILEKMQD